MNQLIGPSIYQVEAELLRRSLHEFSVKSWSLIEPGTELVDNWHLEVIDAHLEAVTEGKIRNLIINMPPRMMKSTKVNVQWPAWEWTRRPTEKYLTASYAEELATRDSLKMRTLVESNWYRQRFSDQVSLSRDQSAKTRFENTASGYRITTSANASAVGEGGSRIIVDDPHDPKKAMFSDTVRQIAIDWWDNVMVTRYNDPKKDPTVIVMQRVHMADLSGHLLAKNHHLPVKNQWQHLCLPMRYDGVRRRTLLGEYDPRREIGELLFPERFPEEIVKSLEKDLGTYGSAAQLQQQPIALGGNIFKRDAFQFYMMLPKKFDEITISVDCTFKDTKGTDFVSIQVWGYLGPNEYLIHRVHERMGFAATVKAVKAVNAAFPTRSAVLIEDKANGPAVIETLKTEVAGIIAIEPEGGKTARAYAMEPTQASKNIFLPDPAIAPWVEHEFLPEVCGFPGWPNDDDVDAMTQAHNWHKNRMLAGKGIFDYYRQLYEAKMSQKK